MSGNELNVSVKPLDDATETKLREALRFSASRSVISSGDEQRILSALSPQPVEADEAHIWGWVIPRGGKKKPVILDRENHDEISAICEEEIHGLGYFPLYASPQPVTKTAMGGGWMPIETAPKDGTPLLARYEWQGADRFMVIRRHKEHPWWMADHDSYIKHDDSKDTHRNFGFTHWMPIPAPPATTGGEEL